MWRTVIFAAALGVLALLNQLMLWLPQVTFTAAAVAVLLTVVGPRPAWLALTIAGVAGWAVRSELTMIRPAILDSSCPNSQLTCIQFGYSTGETTYYSTGVIAFFLELAIVPSWLVVAGVLGWAIRRLSWRTAVAAAVYAVAVWAIPEQAPIVLFTAAAAAIGPRRDVHYLAGLGILALALLDQHSGRTPLVLIITLAIALGLGILAVATKNGADAAVALVSLATATLTPFLSAGVLLAYVVIRRTAERSAGTSRLQPAE